MQVNQFFRHTFKNKNFLSKIPIKYFSSFEDLTPLTCISPLDGRYFKQISGLQQFYSEAGLMKYRTVVEIEWLKFLISDVFSLEELSFKFNVKTENIAEIKKGLESIITNFALSSAEAIKEIEKTTNHDVKAVEYYIKGELKKRNIPESIHELVHFCCTSEDINNLSWGLIVKESLRLEFNPTLDKLTKILTRLAEDNHEVPMMARTHGQPATPTTVGKEFANFAYRVNYIHDKLKKIKVKGKFNGAVGNFNAHMVVLPNKNWTDISKTFIERQLGLEFNPYSTQIESHDSISEIFNYASLINSILIGFSRDIWTYNSMHYFKQRVKKNEVGSSTMPHKVNPIDFENAEGNLGLANGIFNHMSGKLVISRLQRDLSDSTVLRNMGVGFGYSILAYNSLEKGLNKLEINKEMIVNEINNHWELLAEPLQTVMKYNGYKNPYELLKDMTRGKSFSKQEYTDFVKSLDKMPQSVRDDLLRLTPSSYLGNSSQMAKNIKDYLKL